MFGDMHDAHSAKAVEKFSTTVTMLIGAGTDFLLQTFPWLLHVPGLRFRGLYRDCMDAASELDKLIMNVEMVSILVVRGVV
jgi:hypothetical protein